MKGIEASGSRPLSSGGYIRFGSVERHTIDVFELNPGRCEAVLKKPQIGWAQARLT